MEHRARVTRQLPLRQFLLRQLRFLLPLAGAILWLPFALAETDDSLTKAKTEAIRELIRITNAQINEEAFNQAFTQQMVSVLRSRNPGLTERAERIVEEEVRAVVAQEMTNETLLKVIYPIYARYFTLEDIEALITFNRSSAGRKANEVMPMLIQESRTATQTWSREIGPRITERVLHRFRDESIDVNTRSPGSRLQ